MAMPQVGVRSAASIATHWYLTWSFYVGQVYVVGDVGIEEELDLKGIAHIGGPADAGKQVELKPGYALPHDHDVCP